jgi:TATA-box binding protein (TBP) (component of TFIID and TFIIIB)
MSIKNFDDIIVSTQTVIGNINIEIKDIGYLFEILTITPYEVIEKRRGRKKKGEILKKEVILEDGKIITVKFEDKIRGVDLKKSKGKKVKFFRNALTIVIFIEGKRVNFKITKNGKLQFTGCKSVKQARYATQYLWKEITKNGVDQDRLFKKTNDEPITINYLTVMTNIDFNVGFNINREELDIYINSSTLFNSLLETSFGYTGVNIKILVDNTTDFDMDNMIFNEDSNAWMETKIKYSEYINILPKEEQEKIRNKKRYNTFLIFQSGNVIMSGYNRTYMRDVYYKFAKILLDSREHIEEVIKV